MSDDPDAAIQWLEAAGSTLIREHPVAYLNHLRTVIAAAKRPPLTDATRERLIEVVMPIGAQRKYEGAYEHSVRIVDAILAEYAPVASTRERLAEAIDPNAQWGVEWAEPFDRDRYARRQAAALERADRILASGAVEDRAEVEAKAIEDAVRRVERPPVESAADRLRDQGWDEALAALLGLAAKLREGRS